MFNKQPLNLLREFQDVAELAASLKDVLAQYGGRELPMEKTIWAAAVTGYSHVMICLVAHLASHPEWIEELDSLMEPVGCPAQKVPLIEEFLSQKGVRDEKNWT